MLATLPPLSKLVPKGLKPEDKLLWRANSQTYSVVVDVDCDLYGSRAVIELIGYRVIKRTPKGAWIDLGFGAKRWVAAEGRKLFAWSSEKLALESLAVRRGRQASIYEHRAARAREFEVAARSLAEAMP